MGAKINPKFDIDKIKLFTKNPTVVQMIVDQILDFKPILINTNSFDGCCLSNNAFYLVKNLKALLKHFQSQLEKNNKNLETTNQDFIHDYDFIIFLLKEMIDRSVKDFRLYFDGVNFLIEYKGKDLFVVGSVLLVPTDNGWKFSQIKTNAKIIQQRPNTYKLNVEEHRNVIVRPFHMIIKNFGWYNIVYEFFNDCDTDAYVAIQTKNSYINHPGIYCCENQDFYTNKSKWSEITVSNYIFEIAQRYNFKNILKTFRLEPSLLDDEVAFYKHEMHIDVQQWALEQISDLENHLEKIGILYLFNFIDEAVLLDLIKYNKKIMQKEDFKKYLDFNCNLNFNKLNYAQIALLHLVNNRRHEFDLDQENWKLFTDLVKKHPSAACWALSFFETCDFHVISSDVPFNFASFIAGVLDCFVNNIFYNAFTNNKKYDDEDYCYYDEEYDDGRFFLYEDEFYDDGSSDSFVSLIQDIFIMRSGFYNLPFHFGTMFEVLSTLVPNDFEATLDNVKALCDKISKTCGYSAELAAAQKAPLSVAPQLLTNKNDIIFIPISDTYELFLLGEEFDNCVYNHCNFPTALFYKVVCGNDKYCLELRKGKSGVYELFEIELPFRRPVKKSKVVATIKRQLSKQQPRAV